MAVNKSYYDLSAASLAAIDEAQHQLTARLAQIPRPPASERAIIQIRQAQLDADWEKIYQETLATSQGHLTISPPTADQIADAKSVLDDLDKLTVDANTIGDVADAATKIMGIWASTKPKPV